MVAERATNPAISVVIATRNSASTLSGLLDSLRYQTFRGFEVLAADASSDDGTVALLEAAGPQLLLQVVSREDAGIYDAWNRCLRRVRGDWVCFLGADDRLHGPRSLETMMVAAASAPADVGIVYGRVALVNGAAETLQVLGGPWADLRKRFRQVMCLPHPATLHRRTLFDRYGGFDTTFRIAGDYEWLLRELKDHDALFFPETVVDMRFGGVSSQPGHFIEALREVRRAQIKNRVAGPGLEWRLAWGRAAIRVAIVATLGERATRSIMDFGRRLRGLPPLWARVE